MISYKQFSKLTLSQKSDFLTSFFKEFDSDVNQELMVFKQLLAVIPNPSEKLVNYIFIRLRAQLETLRPEVLQQFTDTSDAIYRKVIKSSLQSIKKQIQ